MNEKLLLNNSHVFNDLMICSVAGFRQSSTPRHDAVVERHAMSKKGSETKKAEKSRENIKKAQFYVEFHAKPGDKLQKGA